MRVDPGEKTAELMRRKLERHGKVWLAAYSKLVGKSPDRASQVAAMMRAGLGADSKRAK